ncbi:response regulator [Hymenobacter sp.]|jgi:two-component system response regulator|uniref:response regulator n=1 Tax=Hymenobacter sp. TaxID=1898978 RepID=UPI002ED939B7
MDNIDILHVEDDPHCVELVQRALRKLTQPLDYVSIPTGEAALTFLASLTRPPRLLLLDLRLPKTSGLQVLEALRGSEKNRGLPVVVFTTSQEPRDVEKSYQLGANSYIIKPLEYRDFLAAVQELVNYWLTLNHQD